MPQSPDYSHLRGKPIAFARAVERYAVPAKKLRALMALDHIHELRPDMLDEGEVAVSAAIYHLMQKYEKNHPKRTRRYSPPVGKAAQSKGVK